MADETKPEEAKVVKASPSSNPEPSAEKATPPPVILKAPEAPAAVANGNGAASKLVEELAMKLRERDERLDRMEQDLKRIRELREQERKKPPIFKPGFRILKQRSG